MIINALDTVGLSVEMRANRICARQGRQRNGDVLLQAAKEPAGRVRAEYDDIDAGLARLRSVAHSFLLVGFAPKDLKFDGQFHT